MMADGHAKTGSVSIALKVYLLAVFVGLLFLSDKTRQEPPFGTARDKLPKITALLVNRSVLCDKVKHRGKYYLSGRILHTSNGTSSFQIEKHLLIYGDVSSNPGPGKKPTAKYPCGECHKKEFECIKEPTRTERKGATTTSTLVDVLLSNRLEMFKQCGTYDTALSDHLSIYGLMKDTVKRYQNKIITFRSYKNCEMEVYANKLAAGDLFDDVDDQDYYW